MWEYFQTVFKIICMLHKSTLYTTKHTHTHLKPNKYQNNLGADSPSSQIAWPIAYGAKIFTPKSSQLPISVTTSRSHAHIRTNTNAQVLRAKFNSKLPLSPELVCVVTVKPCHNVCISHLL